MQVSKGGLLFQANRKSMVAGKISIFFTSVVTNKIHIKFGKQQLVEYYHQIVNQNYYINSLQKKNVATPGVASGFCCFWHVYFIFYIDTKVHFGIYGNNFIIFQKNQ